MNSAPSANSIIKKVVVGGYCIGCGACSVQDGRNRMEGSSLGMPQAQICSASSCDDVCPFATATSEDELAESLYAENSYYDERIGFYINNYVGFVAEKGFRKSASSGGVVSWVLAELFKRGEIDGVIHVAEGRKDIFEYQVSSTLDEIINRSKSRYYPVHYDEALKSVLGNGKQYAFVGVPCFVKSVRLLARNNKDVSDSIKYCIAIFCGHLKTKAFSEMIAMQQGVSSMAISSIDFRVKNPKQPANRYSTQVFFKDRSGSVNSLSPVPIHQLYGLDWGLGYFKPKACDWCDDIAGETADLSCGDAWLPDIVKDSLGNNIIVARNVIINKVLKEGIAQHSLCLSTISVDKVYESQAGNYRHRREGLSVRLGDAEERHVWAPVKRIQPSDYKVDIHRKQVYRLREQISKLSHSAFADAKSKDCFSLFVLKMLPLELHYYFLNGTLFRGASKVLYQYFRYLLRKIR